LTLVKFKVGIQDLLTLNSALKRKWIVYIRELVIALQFKWVEIVLLKRVRHRDVAALVQVSAVEHLRTIRSKNVPCSSVYQVSEGINRPILSIDVDRLASCLVEE